MGMHPLYLALDSYLIWFYRVSGYAWLDFFFGTFILAFHALLIGEYTIFLAFLPIRKKIDTVNEEAVRYQNLTMEALKAGDKESYEAANKMANDAFGKAFFLQIALSAARLWPVPFALAWMQHRFLEVEVPLPFLPYSLGYIGVFILLYVAAYFLFKPIKWRLPLICRMKPILDAYQTQTREMKSLADLSPSEPEAGKP